jgi:hypothetical protein
MNSRLKLGQVFFKLFPVAQALRANAAKRQVFGRAHIDVTAASAGKVFSASDAALEKNHFIT